MEQSWLVVGGLVALVLLVLVGLVAALRKKAVKGVEEIPPDVALPRVEPPTEAPLVPERPLAPAPVGVDLSQRLSRTRGSFLGKLGGLFGKSEGQQMLDAEWGQIEEALLEGDVGVRTADALLTRLKTRIKEPKARPIRELIQEESEGLLSGLTHGQPDFASVPKPYVISIVGVNGAGKTTTIGKLAKRFKDEGKGVLVGAVDTFRAAAISQLKVWADRAGAEFVTGREGADPGAVAFDSVTAGKARGMDVVLLDTAGRLHTKSNLMDELKKVHRVVKKVIPEAPHETWLVVDGTTGQNAIQQAKVFTEALVLTGVVVTKLDGTAKGGAILAIASELKLPIRFIGVGESAEDLIPFEPKPFVSAILGG